MLTLFIYIHLRPPACPHPPPPAHVPPWLSASAGAPIESPPPAPPRWVVMHLVLARCSPKRRPATGDVGAPAPVSISGIGSGVCGSSVHCSYSPQLLPLSSLFISVYFVIFICIPCSPFSFFRLGFPLPFSPLPAPPFPSVSTSPSPPCFTVTGLPLPRRLLPLPLSSTALSPIPSLPSSYRKCYPSYSMTCRAGYQ